MELGAPTAALPARDTQRVELTNERKSFVK
jgi:hypothetical protein